MLALSLQGAAALMQRLRPAHYHVPVPSQFDAVPATAHAHDQMAAQVPAFASVDHPWSRHDWSPTPRRVDRAAGDANHTDAHDRGDPHAHAPRTAPAEAPGLQHPQSHRHAGIGRHSHSRDDRSVVHVDDVDPETAAAAGNKLAFDGFVLALPPWWLLIARRGGGGWLPTIAFEPPSHRSGLPERPPRSS